MSIALSYVETGRTSQKARTRAALVDAARQLLAEGETPTVERAAAAASISRATAYRYFKDQRSLLRATEPDLGQASLLGDDPPAGPGPRLEIVVDAIARQVLRYEPELRNMLRLSLDPDPAASSELPFRKGRRIVWIAEALSPLRGRLPERDLDRLVMAIAAAVGIDALVWLTDIAGLSRDQATESMRWSAMTLLHAVLAEAGIETG
jgi:AcrR family transcriptional regulator